MDIDKIIKLAESFYSIASSEKVPEKSSNLKTILKNIDSLETYKARIDYAEKCLKHLSSGSSRIVYLSPNNTVIKLAKNDKGIAQNKIESNPKMKSKILNKVLDSSKENAWVEVKFLDKITEKDFEEMTGLEFKNFGKCLKSRSERKKKERPKNFSEVEKTELFKEIIRLNKDFNLLIGDIARISSWGCLDDKPILIDSGLTREVYEKFYESKSASSSSTS